MTSISATYKINPAYLADPRRRNQIASKLHTAGYTYDGYTKTWTRKDIDQLDKYEQHPRNESDVARAAASGELVEVA